MRYYRLWHEAFEQSIKSLMAFRSDFFFSLINLPFVIAADYVAIFIVARNMLIGGWSSYGLIILGGLHMTLGGLESAFIESNLGFFSDRVIAGELDEWLLRPMKALFSVSLMKQSPSALLQSLAGLVFVIIGMAGQKTPLIGWLILIPGLALSLFMTWSIRMTIAEVSLFFKGCDLTVIYSSVWSFQKFPSDIYPLALRAVMFAIPFTLICLPTAVAVTGGGYRYLLIEAGTAAIYFLLAVLLWHAGIKRYTSVSN